MSSAITGISLLKKLRISLFELCAWLIILLDVSIRLILITHNWPDTNSDEATVGLMALHIAQGRDFPAFFYGQGVMGAMEAYMGAALFFVLGPSVTTLRLGVLIFYIAFLVCMYFLTKLLYSRAVVLITLFLLGVGTSEILYRAIAAFAGHPETPLFGALIMLLSTYLGLASRVPFKELGPRQRRRIVVLYAVWGCVSGAAFWNDTLAAPFILMAGVFLLFCCRNTLRTATIVSILLGLFVGILPMILNDLTAPLDQKSLVFFSYLVDTNSAAQSAPFISRFAAAFLVTLPVATGGAGVCTIANWRQDPWPITTHSSPYVMQCTAIHGLWAFVMVVTWVVAIGLEVGITGSLWIFQGRGFVNKFKSAFTGSTMLSPLEHRARILRNARLMLLGSAGLTWLVFALSVQSIAGPWGNHRYFIGLAVATPALVWPLWLGIKSLLSHTGAFSPVIVGKILCVVILLFYAGTLVKGTFDCFNIMPATVVSTQQKQAFADSLVQLHLKDIYSDYWTCDLVMFLTREQLICSVLDEQLQPGVNRYTPYVAIVAHDPDAAYVFIVGSLQEKAFIARIARTGLHYTVIRIQNYNVYRPLLNSP